MTDLNIFGIIRKATGSHYEPIHTKFLAEALKASLCANGDRSLFDGVWRCCAPCEWGDQPPSKPRVSAEEQLRVDSVRSKRIDITIVDAESRRVVGIEAKTSDGSAKRDQLEDYLERLEAKYCDYHCAIAYLTPFDRIAAEHGGIDPNVLQAVRVYDRFRAHIYPKDNARHVSWLQIAQIEWDDTPIWLQHRSYVENEIANAEKERSRQSRNRHFEEFFSEDALDALWTILLGLKGVMDNDSNGGVTIDLRLFTMQRDNLEKLVNALVLLIQDDEYVVYTRTPRGDPLPSLDRSSLVQSVYGEVHKQIFELESSHFHLKITGEKNYGLRVAHTNGKSVSILTCDVEKNTFTIGQRR